MQENPYATITGLVVKEKNTFLQFKAPSESSSEGVKRKGARRREQSAPPSTSMSSSTGTSAASSCTNTDEIDNLAKRAAPCEEDLLFSDEEVQDVAAPGKPKRVYNLCKNKRVRLRNFEVKAKEDILENPHQSIDDIPFPAFIANTPDPEIVNRLKAKFLEFQQKVLAGENPDPNFRHPSTRTMPAAGAGGRQQGGKQRGKAWSGKQKNIMSL